MNTLPTAAGNVKAAKYLVCVDEHPESRIALKLACMKASMRGGSVEIMHVTEPTDFQTLGGVAERMREERRGEGERLLNELSGEAGKQHNVVPTLMLREGQVGDEILAAALEDPDVNMIVIGIAQQGSGRGTLATWLAGQLGNKLFIPLLMVPGNLTDQQLLSLV